MGSSRRMKLPSTKMGRLWGAGWEAFKGLALDVLTSESSRCFWRQAGVVDQSLGQPSVQIQVGAGEP